MRHRVNIDKDKGEIKIKISSNKSKKNILLFLVVTIIILFLSYIPFYWTIHVTKTITFLTFMVYIWLLALVSPCVYGLLFELFAQENIIINKSSISIKNYLFSLKIKELTINREDIVGILYNENQLRLDVLENYKGYFYLYDRGRLILKLKNNGKKIFVYFGKVIEKTEQEMLFNLFEKKLDL